MFSRPLAFSSFVALQDLLLRGGKHAVQTAQHGEGQDHVRVLAALEIVAQDLIRNRPDEVRDLLKAIHVVQDKIAG
jgi:hypothetical protein